LIPAKFLFSAGFSARRISAYSAGVGANNHYIAGNRAGVARASRFMTALDDIPAWPCERKPSDQG
jgi:hypothetical protein